MKKIYNYLKLMRVKHYIKNFLIFLPIIFSKNLFSEQLFLRNLIGFFMFSFASSVIYILNDLKDMENDKLHFKKKNRPLASNMVSKKSAILLMIFLIFIIIFVSIISKISVIYILIYMVINILYSFGLKNVPVIDILFLTSGFIIRVLFGAFITNVEVSSWLYLTVMSIAMFLSLGKRRNEIGLKKKTREVLKYYNKDFLDKNMYMFLGMGIVFYSLWTINLSGSGNSNNYLVWTVPLIIVIFMRYNLIIEKSNDGDPIEVLFSDKVLLSVIVIYFLILFFIMYII